MAMLIVIFGVAAAVETPDNIFPTLVFRSSWSSGPMTGFPADDMSKWVDLHYERTLSSQVNDIEHIESRSSALWDRKVFFQRGVNINGALAQTTAASQIVLQVSAAGDLRRPSFSASTPSSVPVIQLALSSKALSQAQYPTWSRTSSALNCPRSPEPRFHRHTAARLLQVEVEHHQVQKLKPTACPRRTSSMRSARAEHRDARRNGEGRRLRYTVARSMARRPARQLNDVPIRVVDGTTIFLHDVAVTPMPVLRRKSTWLASTVERRVDDDPEDGAASTLDVINGVKALLPRLRETLPESLKLNAINDQSSFVNAAVNSVHLRERGCCCADRADDPDLLAAGVRRSHHHDLDPLAILTSVTLCPRSAKRST